MALLLSLLLLAPKDAENRVPEVLQLLKAGESSQAISVLKEIRGHKANHTEAKALVVMIRKEKNLAPEVVEQAFLALEGIGSRKVTKDLLRMLDHSRLKKREEIRVGCCRAFGGSADPAAVEAVIDQLTDVSDHVIAAAAEAAGSYRYANEKVRKDLFKHLVNIYSATWNLKESIKPELKGEKSRAEKRWAIIAKPMERSLQLLSNTTQNDPSEWRRWFNKNKRKKWDDLEEQ